MNTSPKAVNSGQTEREAFEAWRKRLQASPNLTIDREGYYEDRDIQIAWSGWEARAASTQASAAATDTATGEREIWEYSFIHSSALGRPDEKITLLTYDKDTAFKPTCFDQKLVCSAGIAIAEVCQDGDGFKHIAEIVEELDDIPVGTKLYALALAEQSAAPMATISSDKCDPEVYKQGQTIGYFDIPKETANAICAGITAITGVRVDWHYFAGRVHMLALPLPPASEQADEAVTEAARDAARYRWLVANCFDWAAPGDGDSFDHIELHFESDMLSRDDESVGRAIDAEIAKEPK